MKRIIFAALALTLALVPACNQGQQEQQDVSIETEKQKISYSLGVDIGASLTQGPTDLDYSLVAKGLVDSALGDDLALSPDEMETALGTLQQQMQADQQKQMQEQMKQMQAQMEKSMASGKAYMEKNAKKEDVEVLDSGLQFEVLEKGQGPSPTDEDVVTVHYRGELVNGTVFDSSYQRDKPATFPVDGVIPGFTEGVKLMHKGGKARLVIPPDLAYGDQQAGPNIPAGATLVFEVELLGITDEAQAAQQ